MMSALWQAIGGRDFVSGMLFGDISYTDPRSMEAIQEFKKMIDKGYINSDAISVDYAEQAAIYASRKSGYVLFHNVVPGLDRYEAEGLDMSNIGTFVLPNKDPNVSGLPVAGLSQTWVVAKNAQNKEAAYIFLDYILSPEYQQKLAHIDGGWNMGMGASLIDDIDALDMKYGYLKDALRDINKGTAYNCSPYMPGTMRTVYTQSIQEMMIKNLTPQQVMENIQKAKLEQLGK
jgi:ABC-type glycerol-3-phosphate transport system substrate-binding protein